MSLELTNCARWCTAILHYFALVRTQKLDSHSIVSVSLVAV